MKKTAFRQSGCGQSPRLMLRILLYHEAIMEPETFDRSVNNLLETEKRC